MTQILLPGPWVPKRDSVVSRATTPSAANRSWTQKLCGRLLEKLGRGAAIETSEVSAACDRAVHEARAALRHGAIDEAQAILRSIVSRDPRHAAWLNLMGVISESRGDWRRAKRYYGQAMRADRRFGPAEQNMRRWYELFTFGRTRLPVALGDDPSQL